MISRECITVFYEANRWRLPLVAAFLAVTAIGYYAFGLERRYISPWTASLDGKKFLAAVCGDPCVIDHEGRVLHRLHGERMSFSDRPMWTIDEDLVYIHLEKDRSRCVVKLTIRPDGQVIRQRLQAKSPVCVYGSPSGHVVHVESITDEQGHFLRFVQDGDRELRRIEFGAQENVKVIARQTPDGDVCLAVQAQPAYDGHAYGNQDFVLTDGNRSTTLILDPNTAERRFSLSAEVGELIIVNSNDYIARQDRNNRNAGASLVSMRDPERVLVADLPTLPIMVDEHRMIVPELDTSKQRMLHLYDFRTPGSWTNVGLSGWIGRDSHDLERLSQLYFGSLPIDDGNILIPEPEGAVSKLDLQSGQQRQLLTVRPWYLSCYRFAVWGLPILSFVWLWVARRHRVLSPIIESLGLVTLCCLACLAWYSVAGMSGPALGVPITGLFATIVCLVLIWAANVRSLLGHGVAILIFGLAGILRLFAFWQGRGFNELSSAVILVCGMGIGLVVFRRWFGRLTRPESDATALTPLGQISVIQCLVLTCGVAVYLAVTQRLNVRFAHDFDKTVVWYGVYSAMAAFLAYVVAVFVERRSTAIFFFVAITSALFAGFDWFSSQPSIAWASRGPSCYQLLVQFDAGNQVLWHPHTLVAYVALMVFIMMRFCLSCGWTLETRADYVSNVSDPRTDIANRQTNNR